MTAVTIIYRLVIVFCSYSKLQLSNSVASFQWCIITSHGNVYCHENGRIFL